MERKKKKKLCKCHASDVRQSFFIVFSTAALARHTDEKNFTSPPPCARGDMVFCEAIVLAEYCSKSMNCYTTCATRVTPGMDDVEV